MSIVGKSYLVPLVRGRSDLLRTPHELVNDLGISDTLVTTATKPNGRKETVRLNPMDRTLLGLRDWLKTCDKENLRSVRLTVISERPYTFSVEFSDQSPDLAGDMENIKILEARGVIISLDPNQWAPEELSPNAPRPQESK